MKMNTEIITLVIVLVLLYTRPSALVRFSNTLLGKVLFVGAVIIASLVNPLAGLFFATLMIVLMEQSYEGFKEGNTPIVLPIQVNTVGPYVKDTKLITVKPVDTTVKAGDIPLNKSVLTDDNASDTFDEHTLIKNATDTITIGVADNDKITETIPNSTIQIITSSHDGSNQPEQGNYIKYTDADSNEIVHKVSSIDADANKITFEDDASPIDIPESYKIVDVTDVTTNSKEYKSDNNNDGFKYITITIPETVTTETVLKASGLILPSNEVVAIASVNKTINITISAGVKSENLGDGVALEIGNHSHTHGHSDTEIFVGGRKEGFFAGDEKKETAVKGAYAEETYEDEVVGETVCSSDLCDRIDSEFKLIRPINSNDHTPTNV